MALVAIMATQQSTSAQGLLGKRYVEGGYQFESFNDGVVDDWVHGLLIASNLPLTETWDFNASLSLDWLEADSLVGSTPVDFEYDFTSIRAGVVKHFRPDARIDPFAGIGIRYIKYTLKASASPITLFQNDDEALVDFIAGFESKLSDRLAIRPQIIGGDTLENFDFADSVTSNLYFNAPLIYWWNDNWFSTITFATDFDDSEYGLRFTVGFGEW